jgi:hypothetical protein
VYYKVYIKKDLRRQYPPQVKVKRRAQMKKPLITLYKEIPAYNFYTFDRTKILSKPVHFFITFSENEYYTITFQNKIRLNPNQTECDYSIAMKKLTQDIEKEKSDYHPSVFYRSGLSWAQ